MVNYYPEAKPHIATLSEADILAQFNQALAEKQFQVFYQPQYNHANGAIVGAEALVRWFHPEAGMQFPSDFIPVLERNKLIYRLDMYVFSELCAFIALRLETGAPVVPISFNSSRHDLVEPTYLDELEEIRKRYNVPVDLLHIEITETAIVCGTKCINGIVEALHHKGYRVAMDDFGSGYSSLNVLKDVDFDILKLDMKFFSGDLNAKAGTVISSVVYMAERLGLPVISEGVETKVIADYMYSLGCNYIQGYYYSKPVPARDFIRQLESIQEDHLQCRLKLVEHLDMNRFWNPESLETLIFSNYVGAAAIIKYNNHKVEVLRVNQKYLDEIGQNFDQANVLRTYDFTNTTNPEWRKYDDMLQRAIKSQEEEECETWRVLHSDCCGDSRVCLRASVRILGTTGEEQLFYVMIRNITQEKLAFEEIAASDRRFRAASEQANVYAWEYDIATKDMHPCFRCMRDLGLPVVVHNYPEPAIKMGIFPPEYADMYRDWHKQIAAGVPHLEAIIPLTVGRIPFHVRYTTEFDKFGHPVKAYGSATLVIQEDEKAKE